MPAYTVLPIGDELDFHQPRYFAPLRFAGRMPKG